MARAWRIEFEGALYHVFSRGNEKQDTEALLSQFVNVKDKHIAYREAAQKYSKEERWIWEEL